MIDINSETHKDKLLSLKEITIIVSTIVFILGYVVTALISQTIVGMLLLPVILAPIMAFFWVKCFRCRSGKPGKILRNLFTQPEHQTSFWQWTKYLEVLIYSFLFAILSIVSTLWFLKH